MNKRGSVVPWLLLLVLIGLMAEQPAKAYADPGSGALLWQVIASGFVAVMFYFRRFLNWGKRKRDDQEN